MANDRAGFVAAAGMLPPRRAPYTFVRLNEVVLPSPVGNAPSHARPLPDGVCGRLTVVWRVETPLLIGGPSNDTPVTLGEGGDYILPGASLRGTIRAVTEIVSFGRLAFVDDDRFGLRDYDHVTWKGKTRNLDIRAGWLSEIGGDRYRLEPVVAARAPITGIVRALGNGDDLDRWHRRSLRSRMEEIARAGLAGEIDLGKLDPGLAGRRGTLVVAGAALRDPGQTTNKIWEAAFTDEPDGPALNVPARAFAIFDRLTPQDGAQHEGPPEANWSYWRPRLKAGGRVPVFFRGQPGGGPFFMWLTRLMRAPFDHTIRDIARRSQSDLDGNDLDLVEALFGWVPEQEPEGVPPRQRRGREQARQGRVFFHHARAVGAAPVLSTEMRGVTMQPRASFYPFYLRPAPGPGARHPVDYDSPYARLAGRKRYPARNGSAPSLPQPPDPGRLDQTVALRFLRASPTQPLAFASSIRLHNVSEVELGALVWALTFGHHGRDDGGYRHMLGRAKAFGFGQVRAEIRGHALERNRDGSPADPGQAMAVFEDWALDALRRRGVTATTFAELPEIRDLLAAAHAPTGNGLAKHLCFTEAAGNNSAERTLKGYQKLRNLSGHEDRGASPGRAGQPAREEPVLEGPADQDFIGLPGYPWV